MFKRLSAFVAALTITATAAGMIPANAEDNYNTASAAEINALPSKRDLSTDEDTKNFFPPIESQGAQGSCVAFSITYYQFTYQMRKILHDKYGEDSDVRYSPSLSYNEANDGKDEGTDLKNVYNVLQNKGALTLEDFEYNDGYGESISVEEYNLLSETEKKYYKEVKDGNNKVTSYTADSHYYRKHIRDINLLLKALKARVTKVNKITVESSGEDGAINAIKEQLAAGNVVATGGVFYYKNSHTTYKRPVFIDGKPGNSAFIQNAGAADDKHIPCHGYVIVGYDDNVTCDLGNGTVLKGAFKIANSWGESYGRKGYSWIMYDAFYEKSSKVNLKEGMKRYPAFSDQEFYTIEVDKQAPKLVSEVDVITNNIYDYSVYTYSGRKNVAYRSGDSNDRRNNESSVYSGPLLTDMTKICGDDYYSNKTYYFDFGAYNYKTRYLVKGIAIRDDLGNIVAEKKYDYDINEYTSALNSDDTDLVRKYITHFKDDITVDLKFGDVNYDGVFDSADATLISEFASGKEASSLQKDLGDFDKDGKITMADANMAADELDPITWAEDGTYIGNEEVTNLEWNAINGFWYFLDSEGKKVVNQFIYDSRWNGNIFVDEKGRCIMNSTFTYNGKTYYADGYGVATEV
ncbi:MAG: hypothetical protein K6G33_09570 [Ruminococcus sp.]|uniref:dockerin type I domain-containing protein n=1 Tax=Ruminococcus sp. TaxID=41978 RepID=UPI0025DA634B|nr:dockerin type I domain-containing protein [Ruminococcus sp.]MCR5600971.1 hypothetical protein [Ruminococcus sp.]